MLNKSTSINLLKKDQQSFVDKFIKWALTIGRGVVILTEAVALFAFVFRFTLDSQLIDLQDEIKEKQAYINLLKDQEATYRNLQERIALANKYSDSGVRTTQAFTSIVQLAPTDLFFTNISMTEDRMRIEATIQSIKSLSRFIDKLKNQEMISSVSLDHVENKTSNATIVVSITIIFKNNFIIKT